MTAPCEVNPEMEVLLGRPQGELRITTLSEGITVSLSVWSTTFRQIR